mmetsp:Transcript_2442/g.6523  ORF Transcript_2442/g.6523 Transcript_2442/m.6523 type:complete len:278 (-) Transcript_2442:1769-2602(-)
MLSIGPSGGGRPCSPSFWGAFSGLEKGPLLKCFAAGPARWVSATPCRSRLGVWILEQTTSCITFESISSTEAAFLRETYSTSFETRYVVPPPHFAAFPRGNGVSQNSLLHSFHRPQGPQGRRLLRVVHLSRRRKQSGAAVQARPQAAARRASAHFRREQRIYGASGRGGNHGDARRARAGLFFCREKKCTEIPLLKPAGFALSALPMNDKKKKKNLDLHVPLPIVLQQHTPLLRDRFLRTLPKELEEAGSQGNGDAHDDAFGNTHHGIFPSVRSRVE